MFNVMNLSPFQSMGWLLSCLWEVKTPVNINFVSCQVRGAVRSETVAFCTGLGRRAHHNAQQMESFCLSSASLSTLQTWCFLISFIVITGKRAGFWNREAILHTSSSQCLAAYFFLHEALLLWPHMMLFSVDQWTKQELLSSELNLLI